MKKILLSVFIISFLSIGSSFGQIDSLLTRKTQDTTKSLTQQDALYTRPFIYLGKTTTAVGGYLEGNTNYFITDGVSDGFSMEMRRFNIFLYSTIAKRIKFLSELEFEHGTEEINVETALIDFEIHPAFNFRTGILLAPIGAFNVNHDSPKWEFIERPWVSNQLIPTTLSEVGFGFHGKFFGHNKVFTYDLYAVNGLRDEIILNDHGRTFLQSGKNPEMFGEDNNGTPMYTGRIALKHRKIAEVGLSYYGGTYNTFKIDGIKVQNKRSLGIFALDFNTKVLKASVAGEFALVKIDVPQGTGPFTGNRQQGGYIDVVYPILKRSILKYENTVVNLNVRVEYVDFNVGKFEGDVGKIYDEKRAIVPGVSIRPSTNTVLRANYRYHWERDVLGNPTIRTAGFQFGFASYF